MSIIHDALKKVQQKLGPEDNATQISPATENPDTSVYLYEKPAQIEDLPPVNQETGNRKSPTKIKSLFVLSCAIVITVASVLYIYRQFPNAIGNFKNFVQQSFHQLLHKIEPLAFQIKAPEKLKALGTLTINPSAGPNQTQPPAPVTLNIHGVMSNGSNNVVLIDDQVYQEGDEVDGAKIIKIDLDSITVSINGAEQTIPVKK